ncbi:MAG: methionine aminopeptidase [Desulfuromonas sp.]|nr:MAG: methionine aminopeptidase [Desulfuromonas sp.]
MSLLSRLFNKKIEEPKGEIPPEVLPLRNDPCWCGSGMKYKKCHQEEDRQFLARKRERDIEAQKACSPVFG